MMCGSGGVAPTLGRLFRDPSDFIGDLGGKGTKEGRRNAKRREEERAAAEQKMRAKQEEANMLQNAGDGGTARLKKRKGTTTLSKNSDRKPKAGQSRKNTSLNI